MVDDRVPSRIELLDALRTSRDEVLAIERAMLAMKISGHKTEAVCRRYAMSVTPTSRQRLRSWPAARDEKSCLGCP